MKKFILQQILIYRNDLFKIILIILAAMFAGLLTPWPLGILVDKILPKNSVFSEYRRIQFIVLIPVAYVVIISLRGYFNSLRHVRFTKLGESIGRNLSEQIFSHLLRLPVSFYDKSSVGDILSRTIGETETFKNYLVETLTLCSAELLMLIGGITVMLWTDWQFAIISIIGLVPLFVVFSRFPLGMRFFSKETRVLEGKRNALVQETLSAIRLVKSLVSEKQEISRFHELSLAKSEMAASEAKLDGRFMFCVEVGTAIGMGAILSYGSWRVFKGTLLLGQFLVFFQYLTLLYAPVARLSRLRSLLTKSAASYDRIQEILLQSKEDYHPNIVLPISEKTQSHLSFRNVKFSYDSARPLLKKINLDIKRGEKVAIIGETGCGKSTLIHLLLHYYPIHEGEIIFDGTSLKQWPLELLRKQIAVVSQECELVTGTIRDNLFKAVPDANEGDLIRAAGLAQIHNFIVGLKDGYDTLIGEKGITLSGGERQRLSIARALLKGFSFLILDEPTSAIDSESEEMLIESLSSIMDDKTLFFITHRPSILRLADRVLELKDGKLFSTSSDVSSKSLANPLLNASL